MSRAFNKGTKCANMELRAVCVNNSVCTVPTRGVGSNPRIYSREKLCDIRWFMAIISFAEYQVLTKHH